MSKHDDPFARWHDGNERIIRRELAGEPVPHAWYVALDALEEECKRLEDARRRGATQAALFPAPGGRTG